jgi:hypothetical protein
MISSAHFVFGVPHAMPPALTAGWAYVADPQEWLLVRDPVGHLYFVACVEGDYCLFPRCVATEARGYLKPGDVFCDTESPVPLPILP